MAGLTTFKLCFCMHRVDGRVWYVQIGRGKWKMARAVVLRVPTVATVYRGRDARQPKAYLRGTCSRAVWTDGRRTLVVT